MELEIETTSNIPYRENWIVLFTAVQFSQIAGQKRQCYSAGRRCMPKWPRLHSDTYFISQWQ